MYKFYNTKTRGGEGPSPYIETDLSGLNLILNAQLNKGCAFTHEEREQFNLIGYLPEHVETILDQTTRAYAKYQSQTTHLEKNLFLNALHDENETLFYKLVGLHLEEMLPIVYTPTVGDTVQQFSHQPRVAKGLYLSYLNQKHIHKMIQALPDDLRLIVVTDGEAVLGVGDQGVGGIHIARAKLMVYTLCGGVNPYQVLPVHLDTGTNNPHLLNDPLYLGYRNERIKGQAYDDFVDQFVHAVTQKFPHLLLHFEDFGRDNARRLLDRYREKICTINGDIQSTGVIALATVLAGVHASGIPFQNHRIVILGAGTAGLGIADSICSALERKGLTAQEAKSHFWLLDKQGLLIKNGHLPIFQAPYARDSQELMHWILRDPQYISLYDVVKNVKPTILIGCSTVAGAFNEEIVKLMASNTSRPIIMPLSNPNMLSEATPEDLIKWTNNNAIIATGSPFADVHHNNESIRIAQSNNAFAFPGIGLGVLAAKAKLVTDSMLSAATDALSEYSPAKQNKMAPLLPKLSEAKMVSQHIALAVAKAAVEANVAEVAHDTDFEATIQKIMWEAKYYPYRKI